MKFSKTLVVLFGVLSLAQAWQGEYTAAIYYLGWMAFVVFTAERSR